MPFVDDAEPAGLAPQIAEPLKVDVPRVRSGAATRHSATTAAPAEKRRKQPSVQSPASRWVRPP
jgi:hypothetical protein